MSGADDRPTVLLATLGTSRYSEVEFELEDAGRHRTRYAPAASARLAVAGGGDALVLCTEDAERAHFADLARELEVAGLVPRAVRIPLGRTGAEQQEILAVLQREVPEGARVVADFTFALRHLGLLYLVALEQLAALRDIRVERILYGAVELRSGDGPAPLLDVTWLHEAMGWLHAAAAFRRRGDLAPVRDLVRGDRARAHRSGQTSLRDALGPLERGIAGLSEAEHMGLPLETGVRARRLLDQLGDLERKVHPALGTLLSALRPRLEAWAAPAGCTAKGAVALDPGELERELRLVEHYLETGNQGRALRILREWLVNLTILQTGERERWLDRDGARLPAERLLNGLAERARFQLLDGAPVLKLLAGVWKAVADLRNHVAHGAFDPKELEPTRERVAELVAACRELLAHPPHLDEAGQRGTLLVTPLGLSPGVVYTALRSLRPDTLLAVTSREALPGLAEAVERAGFAGTVEEPLILADPHTGFAEAAPLLAQARLTALLARHACVVVNVTGGTTLLTHLAAEIASRAARLAVPVRRVALVDRRPPEVQRVEPWVVGEVVDLDGS